MTVSGEQPDALVLALDDQAIAVVFDFVDPIPAGGDFGPAGRDAGFEGASGHGGKIGSGVGISSPLTRLKNAANFVELNPQPAR